MNRFRRLVSLLLALLLGGAMFALCYWTARQAREMVGRQDPDELAWLAREFRLTDAQLKQIRALHEVYRPQCEALCVRVATKHTELTNLLNGATNVSAAIEQKLAETATVRAECQAAMLRHFQEVARVMPPAEGARYLAEMQRLALGLDSPAKTGSTPPLHYERR